MIEMKFWLKVQKTEGSNGEEIIVGACDEELLGKEFGHLKISESFFKGELIEINDALEKIKSATIANLIGKKIVSAALERGLVSKDEIKKVEGIPNAQIFLI